MIRVGVSLIKNLIPLYREKEMFTIFYDTKQDKLVKLPHRKKTYILYVVLFILVLYSIPYVVNVYNHIDHSAVKLLIVFALVGITYLASHVTYYRYYLRHIINPVFPNSIYLEKVFVKGRKQFRIESVTCFICAMITLISVFLFLLLNQLIFMIFANLFFGPCFIYIFMRPIKRMKLLRKERDLKKTMF